MADREHPAATSTEIHRPYRWTPADAAAREAIDIGATNADDVGCVAWQQDDESVWTAIATGTGAAKWARPVQPCTTSLPGTMSAADKTKLDGVATGAQVCSAANVLTALAAAAGSVAINSQKVTGMAAGAATGEGVHFGQLEDGDVSIDVQTGTTYTLVLADAGKLVTLNNASAITLTVPANSTVAYPVGTNLLLAQLGAGQVTVAPAGGVTIRNAAPTLKFRTQYSQCSLVKIGTDEWLLSGDLAVA